MPIVQVVGVAPNPVTTNPATVTLTVVVTPAGRRVRVAYDLDQASPFTFCSTPPGTLHPSEQTSTPAPAVVARDSKTVLDEHVLTGATAITRLLCLSSSPTVTIGATVVTVTGTDMDAGITPPGRDVARVAVNLNV